jgi:hypothetical protein
MIPLRDGRDSFYVYTTDKVDVFLGRFPHPPILIEWEKAGFCVNRNIFHFDFTIIVPMPPPVIAISITIGFDIESQLYVDLDDFWAALNNDDHEMGYVTIWAALSYISSFDIAWAPDAGIGAAVVNFFDKLEEYYNQVISFVPDIDETEWDIKGINSDDVDISGWGGSWRVGLYDSDGGFRIANPFSFGFSISYTSEMYHFDLKRDAFYVMLDEYIGLDGDGKTSKGILQQYDPKNDKDKGWVVSQLKKNALPIKIFVGDAPDVVDPYTELYSFSDTPTLFDILTKYYDVDLWNPSDDAPPKYPDDNLVQFLDLKNGAITQLLMEAILTKIGPSISLTYDHGDRSFDLSYEDKFGNEYDTDNK